MTRNIEGVWLPTTPMERYDDDYVPAPPSHAVWCDNCGRQRHELLYGGVVCCTDAPAAWDPAGLWTVRRDKAA